jgi:DNA-binding transcriptional ArsR family regulator
MAEGTRCKVDIVADRYDLTAPGGQDGSLDEYLVRRWTGDGESEALGYEQLTEWFNRRLLRQVYETNGRETLGTRIESEFEALVGDDDLLRQEVIDDLESDGIDAETLREDMVSWSTMRRHLKACLDAEKATTRGEASDWELRSIDIARSQVEGKTGDALRSLATKQRLPEGHRATVEVQIKLSCPECPTRVPLEDAVERGYVCKDHFVTASEAPSSSENSSSPSSPMRALIPIGIGQSLPAVLFEEAASLGEGIEFVLSALPLTDLALLV